MQLCARDRDLSFGSLGMAVEHSAPFRIGSEKSSKKQITESTFWMLCHQTAQECKGAGLYPGSCKMAMQLNCTTRGSPVLQSYNGKPVILAG